MVETTRQTAAERRETVLVAAQAAFAQRGLHGTSTEEIAAAAGISQPYLFRLFGTKKRKRYGCEIPAAAAISSVEVP